jgi:hypothetical protein
MDGIEIDHGGGDSVLSSAIHNGAIVIDIGEDFAGRDHGPEHPQGFQRYLDFAMTVDEARRLRDWLTRAIEIAEGGDDG